MNFTDFYGKLFKCLYGCNCTLNLVEKNDVTSYITQNIAETCQKYFQYFIAIEILWQYFCQIKQNISSQLYNFDFLKYFL